ncbi:glycosyltransferase family 2 protein [Microbulbifer celer]|uniref:Glycosyltransferase family 2 protein n=1 Tax=Microbulbifer celer TaxID=435905 RepID=A0ABW3U4Z0_9GAMM|nr:glycosyltransferase family 2 protein [Microbulbifer celer]UFN57877.1 glycosyltransferase family 2 protein [Microbulbifer celer]
MAKRLIWLRHGDEELRFSPMCCSGAITIRKLSLVRVSLPFALNRMGSRLSRRYLPVPSQLVKRWVAYDHTFHPNGARVSYGEWVRRIEPALWPRRTSAAHSVRFAVVMPVVTKSDVHRLPRTLESVAAQRHIGKGRVSVYLLISADLDGASRAAVNDLAERRSRVSVVEASESVVLSEQFPETDAVLLCPPIGVLSEQALHCFAEVLPHVPSARLIYTDEDSISEAGRRAAPKFKPGWNPDLLYTRNYIGDCLLLTASTLPALRAIDFTDPAWSLDLLLQIERLAEPGEAPVVHIPRMIFHRFVEQSQKTLCAERYLALLAAHFEASGCEGVTVESESESGLPSVHWPVGAEEPLVSLLIPTRDMLPVLKLCVDSILAKTTYRNYEILVLDNQSVEPETLAYFEALSALPNVRILQYDAPFNYSAINNFGVEHARGEIVGLVNNDIEVINPEWLSEMVGHARRPQVGCVGAKLFYGDGRIQHAGVVVGLGGLAGHVHKFLPADAAGYMNRLQSTQAFSAVTAACLLVRKATFEAVGGLNERHLQVAFNDVDFCLKVRKAGYRNIWTPHARLYHHESISRGIDNTREKRARFDRESRYLRKAWAEYLDNPGRDPYYSPFLTHVAEDFSLGLNEKRDIPLFR